MKNGSYKYSIIIPTIGTFKVFEKHFPRFAEYCNSETLIILSINPRDKEEAQQCVDFANKIIDVIKHSYVDTAAPKLDVVWSDSMVGFGAAVNTGLRYLRENYGFSENIVIANDDLLVTKGWLKYLRRSIRSKFVTTNQRLLSDLLPTRLSKIFPKGKVGMTGPVSYGASGEQLVYSPKLDELGLDKFSENWHEQNLGGSIVTRYLSGFCFMISKDALEDLWLDDQDGLFDEMFSVGGFEDNDLCIRANNKGWITLIATDCFIGHEQGSTLRSIGDTSNGVRNYFQFYQKYEKDTQRHQKIVSSYRTSIKTVNDIAQFKSSFIRSCKLLDGISVLLTNNPSDCIASYDRTLLNQLNELDAKFIENCHECRGKEDETEKLSELIKDWISDTLQEKQNQFDSMPEEQKSRYRKLNFVVPIKCDTWSKERNERDERNYSHELAESLDPDWIISIDSDEVIEDRITTELLQNWLQHPSMFTALSTISFLNHWESTSLLRQDPPFNRMSGPRIWRVNKNNPQRIVAGNDIGLHCGNSPEYGQYSTVTSSLRMRHLSHVRAVDRHAKYKFYTEIDKNIDTKLVGNTDYSHIIRTNIPVSKYEPNNGIALCMLSYQDDEVLHINRWLHDTHMIFDKKVIVWTEEWDEEDKEWINKELSELRSKDNWYSTGPSWEFAYLSKIYRVDITHCIFSEEKGLAECRNAGLNYLSKNCGQEITWVVNIDPDEICENIQQWCSEIRHCAEDTSTQAWVFKFSNPLNTFNEKGLRNSSISESVRMFLLTRDESLRFSGNVHETISESIKNLRSKNIKVTVDNFPIKMTNLGLSKSKDEMAQKLKKYSKLLEKALHDNPKDSASWVSLGLQFLNDNKLEEALTCFNRGCKYAGGAFLPFRERAYYHLRLALLDLILTRRRLNSENPQAKNIESMINMLNSMKLNLPRVDTGSYNISNDIIIPDDVE